MKILTFIVIIMGLHSICLRAQQPGEPLLKDVLSVDNSHFRLSIKAVEKNNYQQRGKASGPKMLQLHGYSLYEVLVEIFTEAGAFAKIENLSRNPKLWIEYRSKGNSTLVDNLEEVIATLSREFGFSVKQEPRPVVTYQIIIEDAGKMKPLTSKTDPGVSAQASRSGNMLKFKGTLAHLAGQLRDQFHIPINGPVESSSQSQQYALEVNVASLEALRKSLASYGLSLNEATQKANHYVVY